MNIEKKREFIINALYATIIFVIIALVFKYLIPWLMPFIIGFLIASLIQRPIKFIKSKLKTNSSFISVLLMTTVYFLLVTVVAIASFNLYMMIASVIKEIPTVFTNEIQPALVTVFDLLEEQLTKINVDWSVYFQNWNDTLLDLIKSFIPKLTSSSISIVTEIPSLIISFLITIISSYFISMDYDRIVGFVMYQLNDRAKEIVVRSKQIMVNNVFKFIKSYGIIMCITFVELSIGLTIIGVNNAITLALVIAIFDILPVLGTGGIMIPWVIITFINGNAPLAIGLLIVYVIITVIRNILEPKIVSGQVGSHPLVMLMSMYVGVRVIGGLGIIIFPLCVILIKNLNDEGVIDLFKTKKN